MDRLIIDPEFRDKIPPLTEDEFTFHMGRLLGFLKGPSGHGDHNDGRGVVIARVVLDDQHRADAALLIAS